MDEIHKKKAACEKKKKRSFVLLAKKHHYIYINPFGIIFIREKARRDFRSRLARTSQKS